MAIAELIPAGTPARLLRTFVENAVQERKLELLEEIFDRDVAFGSFYPELPTVHGVTNVRRIVASWCDAFPDRRFIVEEIVAEGDVVVGRLRWSGTHEGDLLFPRGYRIPRTGKFLDFIEVYWCRVANEKIVEVRALKDQLRLFQQFSFIPAPAEFLKGFEE